MMVPLSNCNPLIFDTKAQQLADPAQNQVREAATELVCHLGSVEKNGYFTQQNMAFTGFHHAKYGFYQAKNWFYPAKDCLLQQNMDVRRILARKIFILTKNESLTN